MGEAAIQAPGIWGEQKEERNDGKWAAGPVDSTPYEHNRGRGSH